MVLRVPRLALILPILLAWTTLPTAGAKPKADSAVSIKRQIEPHYPIWAYTHGIGTGYAKIAFYVDEQGEPSDFFPIEYSHEAFADALMSTILKWDFVPARQNNVPVKSVCHAYWEFFPDRAIETNALFDVSKKMDGSGRKGFRTLKYREGKDLDDRISMVAFPGLGILRGAGLLEESRKAVRARISFFVDQQGNVVLPQILESSDPQVNAQLEEALGKAVFNPPTYDGKSTIALLERTYDFPILWLDEEPAVGL